MNIDKEGRVTSTQIQESWKQARDLIIQANTKMKSSNDVKRRDIPFVEGDLVWLSSKNFAWKFGTKKFLPKWLGPFKIVGTVGEVSFRLCLPEEWKIHNVFHASLLKPLIQGTRYKAPQPSHIDEDGQPVWELDTIITHRGGDDGKPKFYLVAWKGFSPEYSSWLSEGALTCAKDLLQEYHERLHPHPMLGRAINACVDEMEVEDQCGTSK